MPNGNDPKDLEEFFRLAKKLNITIPQGVNDGLLLERLKTKARTLGISIEEAKRRAYALWLDEIRPGS